MKKPFSDLSISDLKPENILIDEEKKIYLCDFGMSKMLENSKETCRVAGTTEYCSPEQIQFEPLSAASDMWAVGVIAFVLLSKTSPFENGEKHETQNAVINCIYDFEGEVWSDRSALAKSFIQTLLIREPKVNLLQRYKKAAQRREKRTTEIFNSVKYLSKKMLFLTKIS